MSETRGSVVSTSVMLAVYGELSVDATEEKYPPGRFTLRFYIPGEGHALMLCGIRQDSPLLSQLEQGIAMIRGRTGSEVT